MDINFTDKKIKDLNKLLLPHGWQFLPIDKMLKAGWNYKTDDAEKQLKLTENIRRNGQLETIIVRDFPGGFYEVVNGNHRLDSFKECKIKIVLTRYLGKVSQEEAVRKAIETNEFRFDTDTVKLAQRIKEISNEFSITDLAITMPYTETEIENYKNLTSFNWDQYKDNGSSGSSNDTNDDFKTITLKLPEGVADQLESQITRFKKLLHPDEDPKDCSPVQAIEAMMQNLAQIPDDQAI